MLHEASALVDEKINLIPAIYNFFNQPFVVGVGSILAVSLIEAKAEKNIDKNIKVILLSLKLPFIFQYFRFYTTGRPRGPAQLDKENGQNRAQLDKEIGQNRSTPGH